VLGYKSCHLFLDMRPEITAGSAPETAFPLIDAPDLVVVDSSCGAVDPLYSMYGEDIGAAF